MEIKINLGEKRNEKGETFEQWLKSVETEKKEFTKPEIIDACAYAADKVSQEMNDPLVVLLGAFMTREIVRRLFDSEEGEE